MSDSELAGLSEAAATAAPPRWMVAAADRERARRLGAALGLSPLAGQLLINRGLLDVEGARRWLAPRLSELRRPDGELPIAGFAAAVERLFRALTAGETIGVFGDYDADGITSCALLTRFLEDAGGAAVARVARRDSGYGFSVDDVAAFAQGGCRVVVTCDCGTSDYETLAWGRARNIDIIVVDHHQVPERPSEAFALINPHQPGCRFPFKGLASVGVAFYLAAALRTRLATAGRDAPDPRPLLDLVAIGTIGDLAPLSDENRILVHAGLRELGRGARPGLRALGALCGVPEGAVRAADVAMRLGPRLNAPGRLGEARLALELLLATEETRARELACACDEANRRRQEIQKQVLGEVLAQVADRPRRFIVVAGDWHPGVVGIVAAKLVDRYACPAAVIALAGESGRASARSAGGLDLVGALGRASDLLQRFGGHAAAAGFTVERTRIPELADRLDQVARERFGSGPVVRELRLDAEIDLAEIHEPLTEELRRLEPFGVGNPEPCFATRGVVLERRRVVGDGHLQVTLRDGEHVREGIGFSLAALDPGAGARIRAALSPEIDTFRGIRRVRVRLADLQRDPEG